MISLSNRGYPMLRTFAEGGGELYMSLRDAQLYDQRPFRSMLIRGWIAYHEDRGFHITRAGRDAWREFQQTEIFRKNPMLPLTHMFDAQAYGLDPEYWREPVKRKRKGTLRSVA